MLFFSLLLLWKTGYVCLFETKNFAYQLENVILVFAGALTVQRFIPL